MKYKDTVELQWLEHLRDHEYMFEIGEVRASQVRSLFRDIFSISFNMKVCCVFSSLNMKVCCVFSLELPHYTQHTIFSTLYKEEKSALIILNLPLRDFSKGLKNELETAVVNEPSVFEPMKFYSTCDL